jgi:hypothetical protein
MSMNHIAEIRQGHIDKLRRCAADLGLEEGAAPSYAQYEHWLNCTQTPGLPMIARKALGGWSWSTACANAGFSTLLGKPLIT